MGKRTIGNILLSGAKQGKTVPLSFWFLFWNYLTIVIYLETFFYLILLISLSLYGLIYKEANWFTASLTCISLTTSTWLDYQKSCFVGLWIQNWMILLKDFGIRVFIYSLKLFHWPRHPWPQFLNDTNKIILFFNNFSVLLYPTRCSSLKVFFCPDLLPQSTSHHCDLPPLPC